MKRTFFLLAAAFLLAANLFSLDLPKPPFDEKIESRMIDRHTIHITVSGVVTGEYGKALSILQSTNVLDRIQLAYAALLPEGVKPEFVVHSITNGHYYYVNKNKERSDIYEIRRAGGVHSNLFEGVMYVQGERSFGMFESLITMRVLPDEKAQANLLNYNADVHVYPHCMVLRIFLKCFPGVKRYFRCKTAEMQGIITGIFNHMIAADAPGEASPVALLSRQ